MRRLASVFGMLLAVSGCAPLLEISVVQKAVAIATFDPLPPDPAVGHSGGHEVASFLEVGHPLATTITSAEHGAIDLAGLVAAARAHDVIWIGVQPHNPQAYRFAARYMRALARGGVRAPLLLGAVPGDADPQLRTRFGGTTRQQASALSDSLPWEEFGVDDPVVMPGMIEPVIRAAIEARLPLHAGGSSRDTIDAFRNARASSTDAFALGLDLPWHRTRMQALAFALEEDFEHCPAPPPPVSEQEVLLDRVESAGVASRVLEMLPAKSVGTNKSPAKSVGTRHPAVIVIAELRHGRRDVGAPHTLEALAQRRGRAVKQLTVGIEEASWDREQIAQYNAEIGRNDVLWLTEPIYDVAAVAPDRLCVR